MNTEQEVEMLLEQARKMTEETILAREKKEAEVKRAYETANEYFLAAIKKIDFVFGSGYAALNPNLVAAFMNVSAVDFQSWTYAQRTEILRDAQAARAPRQ